VGHPRENSRFPAGMTERKAKAKAKSKGKSRSFASLRMTSNFVMDAKHFVRDDKQFCDG
jgi:hypothetical protein